MSFQCAFCSRVLTTERGLIAHTEANCWRAGGGAFDEDRHLNILYGLEKGANFAVGKIRDTSGGPDDVVH